ncbi:MAG: hypothetical protein M3R01_03070, partial [Actinomycetota bacterium]|nr:hypothetical protein [Actinomycetota bacterium]
AVPPSPELTAAVAELSGFVEGVRGKPFLRPVEVELLADADFERRLDEVEEEDLAELEESERVLQALELIEADIDLATSVEAFRSQSVIGFYDPEDKALVLRGAEVGPYVKATLVHELTHAFDDQHFGLDRPALDEAEDESGLGFASLVEGNAERVEDAYSRQLDGEERGRAEEEARELSGDIDLSGVPPVVIELATFPYQAGPPLVAALLAAGGEGRVDAALREPPTTTEQVLDPATYLSGEGASTVAPPPADGEVIDDGSYGVLALLLTLDEAVSEDALGAAVRGWAGDAYVAWDDADRTCVRASFAMDSATDVSELESALARWAGDHADASVSAPAGEVSVTACG